MEAWIIGSGVIGLTTAVALIREGFSVKLISRHEVLQTTSIAAAAVWYPYQIRDPRLETWGTATFKAYKELSQSSKKAGIDPLTTEIYTQHESTIPAWVKQLTSVERIEKGFKLKLFRIEPIHYLNWLRGIIEKENGELHFLPAGIKSLESLADPQRLIINCSGLGARALCADANMRAVRGVILRVTNPDLSVAKFDDESSEQPTYIVPRRNDCILGGTSEPDHEDLSTTEAFRESLFQRCQTLEPKLKGSQVLGHTAGLRPVRDRVRLEVEKLPSGAFIFHNYGHGGAGYTVAIGCAQEIALRARALKEGNPDVALAPPPPLQCLDE